MKQMTLLVAATLMFAAPMVQAQMNVDQEGINKKITKSDTDIANPKKNAKSAVWIERGKVMMEAATAPTTGLYKGIDEKAATIMFGKPKAGTAKIGEESMRELTYPYFVAYVKDNLVSFWKPTTTLLEGAPEIAVKAFEKAYELENSSAPKVKEGLLLAANHYKQDADNFFSLQKYTQAAKAFRQAYDAQMHPTVAAIDTASVFNAGFLYTVALDYQNGVDNLKEALKYNYENDGDIYYYMFHCYYGLKDVDNAREILLKGLGRYPKNNKIVEGLLGLYSNGGGDPKEIVPIVEKAITDDPMNPELWSGLGRIYDKLGEPDKSINAFAKAAELSPKDFGANFNLGLLYIKKGDVMNQELNKNQTASQAEYNEGLKLVNAAYAMSITPLEVALSLNPAESATIELLKNVCFRLRDEAGIMEKYNKYNEMYKALPAKEE